MFHREDGVVAIMPCASTGNAIGQRRRAMLRSDEIINSENCCTALARNEAFSCHRAR